MLMGRGGDTPQRFISGAAAPRPKCLFAGSRLYKIYIFCCLVACSWANDI